MPRPIAFDLCRLFFGVVGDTPRGIDRVDLGFAHRLFDDPSRSDIGLLPTMTGIGAVTAAEALRIAAVVERHWREGRPAEGDAMAVRLRLWLEGGAPLGPNAVAARTASRPLALRYAAMAAPARWSGLHRAVRVVPQGGVYLNTGQVLLPWPWFFRWLDRRPDVKPVFMLHDLIPIRCPEYAGPFLARLHRRALATTARRAAGVLATTEAMAGELREAFGRLGRHDLPIHVTPLPVSPAFGGSAPLADAPYFVAVGILDQRKNHRLLLHVWRDMIRSGRRVPKLVIAGARGLRTAELDDLVARSPGLGEAVAIVAGLSSTALRDLVAGARALLMPSFAEGFGLPIVEAQALGVPVIASDIPAHREVGGARATYLDPLDGRAWQREILARGERPRAPGTRVTDAGAIRSWDGYFAAVLPFLEAL